MSLLQRDDVHAKQGRISIPRVKGSIAKTYPLQPEDLRLVRAVGHQGPRPRMAGIPGDDRRSMLRRQLDESIASITDQLIRHGHEGLGSQTRGGLDGGREILDPPDFQGLNLDAKAPTRRLRAPDLAGRDRVARVVEHRDARELWKRLLEQPESLGD